MFNMKKLLALVLAVCLCLMSLGAVAEAPAEVPAEDTAVVDEVLATVNGDQVMQSEVDDFTDYLYNYFSQYGYDMSGEDDMLYLRSLALENMISRLLIMQKAKEWGLDQLSDEEMQQLTQENDATWESAIQAYIDRNEPLAADATEAEQNAARMDAIAYYESQGFTMESTLNDAKEALINEKVQAEMVKDAEVTDEDVQTAYNDHVSADQQTYEGQIPMYEYMVNYYGQTSYYMPEGFRGVTHILLQVDKELLSTYQDLQARYEEQQEPEEAAEGEAEEPAEGEAETEPEEPVTKEQVDAAREAVFASVQDTIDAIVEKYNSGTPFEDLIKEYGTDPGMTVEENLKNGYAVHEQSILWDPVFTAAAVSIPAVGGISEPVLGTNGVHIVYYLRDIPGGAVELTSDLAASLREELLAEKEQELYTLTIQEWKAASDIVYSELAQTQYIYPEEQPAEDTAVEAPAGE